MRFHPKDLQRAFFSERHSRVLDASGYATLMRWRLYGEEALAGKEADLWLLEVRRPTLFETPYVASQMRLFGLAETLGEDGWLKVLRLDTSSGRHAVVVELW